MTGTETLTAVVVFLLGVLVGKTLRGERRQGPRSVSPRKPTSRPRGIPSSPPPGHGYQPTQGMTSTNPPQGGSGVPRVREGRVRKGGTNGPPTRPRPSTPPPGQGGSQ